MEGADHAERYALGRAGCACAREHAGGVRRRDGGGDRAPRGRPTAGGATNSVARFGAAKTRARAVDFEHDRARADAERLRTQKIDALASGDDDLASRLEAERDQVVRAADDLDDRLTAARLQAERAERARDQFAQREADRLLAEHSRAAQMAADNLTARP